MSIANDCKKINFVNSYAKYGDHVEAKIILRNKAAEMGANFIMLEKVYVTIDSEGWIRYTGNAFKCPE